ncbi:MAG: hypothetical protein Faunusvirus3_22 [Faunusvirus sp.]|uniref:Uncharacterized protein n=1 Tax=Faunusvirus sp. TaxID=2487766 RepID=A0A3G4ZW57_9VIRU|nr:MAG: hypothetical protein Faunusvirus3_22 [Faunusvirus sp.]
MPAITAYKIRTDDCLLTLDEYDINADMIKKNM